MAFTAIVCSGAFVAPTDAAALDLAPDATFGAAGSTLTSFGESISVRAAKRMPDGGLVLGGVTHSSLNHPRGAVVRLQGDGSADHSFGRRGLVVIAAPDDIVLDVAPRGDGRIYALVRGRVVRLTIAGERDATFGADGFVQLPGRGYQVVAMPDGGVTVVGTTGTIVRLWRFDRAGVRVADYGSDDIVPGMGTIPKLARLALEPRTASLAADGSIVVAAGTNQTQIEDMNHPYPGVVVRFLPNGKPDVDFGTQGVVLLPALAGELRARSIVARPDGRIVVFGWNDVGAVVARLESDGRWDDSFAGDGVAEVPTLRGASSVAVLDNGALLLTGVARAGAGEHRQIGVVRIQQDGSVDPTYGEGGTARVRYYFDEPQAEWESFVLAPLRAGAPALIVANQHGRGVGDDITTVAVTATGGIDRAFGTDGVSTIDYGWGFDGLRPGGVLTLADNSVISVGTTGPLNGSIKRSRVDGSPDVTFGDGGVVTLPFQARVAAQDPAGNIVVAGNLRLDRPIRQSTSVAITKRATDGSPIATFGTAGTVVLDMARRAADTEFHLGDIEAGSDGKVVGAGTLCANGLCSAAAFQLDATGALDRRFGMNGVYIGESRGATELALGADGRVFLLGGNEVTVLTSGHPDGSFGGPGRCNCSPGSVRIPQPDTIANPTRLAITATGQVLIAATAPGRGDDTTMIIARLRPDGMLDTTFGDNGVARGPKGRTTAIVHVGAAGIWFVGERGANVVAAHVGIDGGQDAADARVGLPLDAPRSDGQVAMDRSGRILRATSHYEPLSGNVEAAWRLGRFVGPTAPPAPQPVDATAPTLTRITLPGVTTARTIEVVVDAADDTAVTGVRAAVDVVSLDGFAWSPFTGRITVTLPAVDGVHTVSVQVRDDAGNVSRMVIDITNLVPLPPVVPAGPNQPPVLRDLTLPNPARSRTIPVRIDATDDQRVTEMRTATEDGNWGAWRPFDPEAQVTLSNGGVAGSTKGVFVQVRDAQRRESGSLYRKTTFMPGADPAPPLPPVNAPPTLRAVVAPATTPNPVVLMGIDAVDDVAVTELRTQLDNGAWSAWRPAAPTTTVDLSPVAAGAVRTVGVQVRDAQLRESNIIRTPITYAPAPAPPANAPNARPVLTSVQLPAQTAVRAVTIISIATDDRQVTEMRTANEDGVWSAWRAYAPQALHTLTAGARIKGVSVQVRDAQRLESNVIYTKTVCSAC